MARIRILVMRKDVTNSDDTSGSATNAAATATRAILDGEALTPVSRTDRMAGLRGPLPAARRSR